MDSSTWSTSIQFWENMVDENCSIFPINSTLKQNSQLVSHAEDRTKGRKEKKRTEESEAKGEKRPAIYPLFLYWKIWREKRTTSWALSLVGPIKNPDVHTAKKKTQNNLSWLATEVCSRTDKLLGKSQIMRLTQSTDSFPWHGKCLTVYVLSIQTHLFFFFRKLWEPSLFKNKPRKGTVRKLPVFPSRWRDNNSSHLITRVSCLWRLRFLSQLH